MKKPVNLILLLLLVMGSFLAGFWYSQRPAARSAAAGGRRVLYYRDPMHPAYKSDKPGIAPDCGMQLEPVYAGGDPATPGSENALASMPAGTVHVSPEQQQLIGVRVGLAERTSGTHTIRVLGRVVVDETRVYRLNAAVDGWIREILPNTVGSLVRKDEPLASFYSPEFLPAQQAYLYALGALDRWEATGKETPQQIALTKANIQQAVDSLRNLGMGDLQIEEVQRTRQLTQNIRVTAPAAGFVLARNVSPGQRFERGTEWYRIVDLSHVWILADLFENEAQYFRPGTLAQVSLPHPGKTFSARVSEVLPQFDPATRALKLRLETDNPGFLLRPDMFVDVELLVRLSPAFTVPVDAVLDSGLKKTVFVDRGHGFFEPRSVETGWRFGERVEIVNGLMSGEQVVVSGNFLINSESRLRAAAAVIHATLTADPVCGMHVDASKAKAAGRKSEYGGKIYSFCSDQCKQQFDKEPRRFVAKPVEN